MLEKNAEFAHGKSTYRSTPTLKLCTHNTWHTRNTYFWFLVKSKRSTRNQISDFAISRKTSNSAENNTADMIYSRYTVVLCKIVKTRGRPMMNPSKPKLRQQPLPTIHETERKKRIIRSITMHITHVKHNIHMDKKTHLIAISIATFTQ